MRCSINRPILAFLLFALASLPSWAATLSVSNLNDAGAGSLRGQIAAAAAGDTINFGVTGTITLASTLTLSQNLTITGPGASNLTVSGNNAVQVFFISAGTLTLSGLTVANGSVNDGAGMWINPGATVTLDNCTFDGNSAAGAGGAVVNFGSLRVVSCAFQNNYAGSSGGSGGGARFWTDTPAFSGSHTKTKNLPHRITWKAEKGGVRETGMMSADDGKSRCRRSTCCFSNTSSSFAPDGRVQRI